MMNRYELTYIIDTALAETFSISSLRAVSSSAVSMM